MIILNLYKTFFLSSLCIQLISFVPAFLLKTDKLTDLTYTATFIILTIQAYTLQPYSFTRTIPLIAVILWGLRLGSYLFYRVIHMKKDKRFDGIRENFWKFLGFFLIQGIIVFCISIPTVTFLAKEPGVPIKPMLFFLGIAIWIAGFLIEATADYQKFSFIKQNTGLWIDQGLWYYSRHPNYFGEILCWLGLYIYALQGATPLQSLLFFCTSPLFITFLLTKVSGIPILEKEAELCWGKNPKYQEYKRKTSILILLPKKK